MSKKNLIYVAGHSGMVGSSLCKQLMDLSNDIVVHEPRSLLDLTNQTKLEDFFENAEISSVYMMAGLVGGIKANNSFPAEFLYQNMIMNSNLIHTAYKFGVKRLLILGSACMYPVDANQPVRESSLMTGPVEATNEGYAIAKIAAVKMAEMYRRQYNFDVRTLIPTNMYGPGDHYDLENCHVIPALLQRFHHAKLSNSPEIVIWGSGAPMREFLYVDDFAEFVVNLIKSNLKFPDFLNIGHGTDFTIKQYYKRVINIINPKIKIFFNKKYPSGMKRKLIDSSLAKKLYKWSPKTSLDKGLIKTIKYYENNEL
jgi:GDP-L-fucose synthase